MAEPLKNFFSPALVRRLAEDLARAEPTFPSQDFYHDASAGLEPLELLDRARHIALALARHLPREYPQALAVLLRSLGPELPTEELLGVGMAPFYYLPHVVFVAEEGTDHFALSMQAQHALTQRFSAEFSLRAFLAKDPERTLAVLRGWTADPSAHVRRLVSEGTRLRLPWASRVPWLDAHPEAVLALLERLRDDPASLVRRSVANNLNDLGRVHRGLLVRTCERWLRDAPAPRRALVEHALRGAVKRGDADALRLLGLGHAPAVTVQDVRFEPATVPLGGRVRVTFSLRSTAREAQDLLVNLAVHFVKARGGPRPKVFKVARRSLSARGRVELHTELSLAMHTTRTPRPGTHAVDVVVNGVPLRAGTFEVTDEVRSASTAAPQAATAGTRLSVDDSPLDLETQ